MSLSPATVALTGYCHIYGAHAPKPSCLFELEKEELQSMEEEKEDNAQPLGEVVWKPGTDISFKTLPIEIRQIIYELYFDNHRTCAVPSPYNEKKKSKPHAVALLYTNGQIYMEASVILYTKALFNVTEDDTSVIHYNTTLIPASAVPSTTLTFLRSLLPATKPLLTNLKMDFTTGITSLEKAPEYRQILHKLFRNRSRPDDTRHRFLGPTEESRNHTHNLFPLYEATNWNIAATIRLLPSFLQLRTLELVLPGTDEQVRTVPVRQEYIRTHWFSIYQSLKKLQNVRKLVMGHTMHIYAVGQLARMMGVKVVEVHWGWKDWGTPRVLAIDQIVDLVAGEGWVFLGKDGERMPKGLWFEMWNSKFKPPVKAVKSF